MTKVINGIHYDTKQMNMLDTRTSYLAHNVHGSTTLLKDPTTGNFLILEKYYNSVDNNLIINELRVTTAEQAHAIIAEHSANF